MLWHKIGIGSDHAGYSYKEQIKAWLEQEKIQVLDFGPASTERVDYPDFAKPLAKAILQQNIEAGILICGSGNGMAMTANRYQGIRAAVCHNVATAILARAHNNANIITLGERLVPFEEVIPMINAFLTTAFEAGRHTARVAKIEL